MAAKSKIEVSSGRWPERAVQISLFVFVAWALAMVFLVDIPPILDYPNHLARIWLISGGANDPAVSQIYALDWSRASTNIGIDLLARYAGPLLRAVFLSKMFLFLAIVLPPVGAVIFNRYLVGSWHPFQITILFFAWCTTLIGGFLNFQIGLGLALLFAAADDWLHRFGQVFLFVWRALIFAVLLANHPIAACFFALLIGALEFSGDFQALATRRAFFDLVKRMGAIAVACAVPTIVLFLQAKSLPGGGDGDWQYLWNATFLAQANNFLSAIWSYNGRVDAVFFGVLVVGLLQLSRRGGHAHSGLLLATILLLILSVAAPQSAFATGWIATRFPIMAALVGCAMFHPGLGAADKRLLVATACLILAVFGRMAWISYNWASYQTEVAEVREVLKSVPPGSAVLQAGHYKPKGNPLSFAKRQMILGEDTYRHLAVLAVPQAKSFVPTLFTAAGKQPVVAKGRFAAIDIAEDNLVPANQLVCAGMTELALSYRPYLAHWRNSFDFVLMLNADFPDDWSGFDTPAGLVEVKSTPFAKLYRTDHNWRSDGAPEPAYCRELEAASAPL